MVGFFYFTTDPLGKGDILARLSTITFVPFVG